MQYVSYFILVFGVVGIGLGLYGLVMPTLRARGFSLRLPRPSLPSLPRRARPESEIAAVDSLIAELEQSGFRNSPFESRLASAAAPATVMPALRRVEPVLPTAVPHIDLDEPDEELVALLEEPLIEPSSNAAPSAAALAIASVAVAAEEPAVEEPASEPAPPAATPAAAADPLSDDDLLSFFEEGTSESKTPAVLREAIEEIDINDLLSEARELRALLANRR